MVRNLLRAEEVAPNALPIKKVLKAKVELILRGNALGYGRFVRVLLGLLRFRLYGRGKARIRSYPYIPLHKHSTLRLHSEATGGFGYSNSQSPKEELQYTFKVRGGYVSS